MPCYSPITGYRSRTETPNGKRKLVFSLKEGFADLPVEVPCGVCLGCRISKSRSWALRCVHEAKLHMENSFLTLTYDDEHLPENRSLSLDDLQKFFKRLRKTGVQFRYYACGEYGDNTQRPHYHVILFGHSFLSDRKKHSVNGKGDVLYISKTLTQAWGLGHALIGNFTYAAAAYTARYVMKKQYGVNARQSENYRRLNLNTGEVFYVEPEFCVMSRRPGIGGGWYDKYKKDAFPSDFLVHEGKKHSVPRYYYNRNEVENPEMAKAIKRKRKSNVKDNPENSPDRLRVRELVKTAQLRQLKRSLD